MQGRGLSRGARARSRKKLKAVLEWREGIGKRERQLAACAAAGNLVPALSARVELFEDLLPLWEAWEALRCGRQAGMALLPFTASDVAAVIGLFGPTSDDERASWFRLLRVLDFADLEVLRRRK